MITKLWVRTLALMLKQQSVAEHIAVFFIICWSPGWRLSLFVLPKKIPRKLGREITNNGFDSRLVDLILYNGGKVPSIPYDAKFYKAFGADMVFSLEKVPEKSVTKTVHLQTERSS